MNNSKKIWSPAHQKKYLWLFNYLQTLDPKYKKFSDIDFLNKINKRELIKLIESNKSWGNSSKESLYFTITRWLAINKPDSNFIKTFKELGFKLKKKRDELEGENKLDTKEEENIRPYEYFISILNDIKADEIQTRAEHYKYLILALLTLQPPIRTSFYTSAKITDTIENLDSDTNYIFIKKDDAFFVVNKDKVSNAGRFKAKNELSYVYIKNKELIKILYDSITKFPRTYLFESKLKNTIKDETFLNYLRSITHLKALNVDMMRSIYITHFYNKNTTFNSREELALQMRHSQLTAQKNYLKLSPDGKDDNKQIEKLTEENARLQVKVQELTEELNKLKLDNSPNDKQFIKRRTDILYKINNKSVNPKEDTLNKYNIIYDQEKKIYS